MGVGVFHLDSDGTLASMTVAPYENEDVLHELVLAHPALLAGQQMRPESPRRWAVVLRGTNAAEGDYPGRTAVSLFVDQDGVLTLVSVRRSVDERARREIVGQVLDLVANGLRHWPIADLRATYETTQRRLGRDPLLVIGTLCEDPGMTLEAFLGRVEANRRSGRLRIAFVADEVPVELVRITELLSDQMRPAEVFAVDVTQYRADAYAGSVIVLAVPSRTAAIASHLGANPDEQPGADPATRELLDRVGELAVASSFDLVETPEAVHLRTSSGDVLAVVDLVWDSLEVPLSGISAEHADAAGQLLGRLTHKKLSVTDPSVPAHNVVHHWDDVRILLQQLAEARQCMWSNGFPRSRDVI
jgi:hypothetical protein